MLYLNRTLFLFYLIYLQLLPLLFKKRTHQVHKGDKTPIPAREDYIKSRLENVDIDALKKRFSDLMENERLFADPTLTLKSFAARAGISSHQLSEFCNRYKDTGFSVLVNRRCILYRAVSVWITSKYTEELCC